MPVQSTDTKTPITFDADNETWIIKSGVAVDTNVAFAVSSTFAKSELLNHGDIASAGVDVDMKGDNATVVNAADGYMIGDAGVQFTGKHGVLDNSGHIAVNDTGVNLFGDYGTLINSGHVSASSIAVELTGLNSSVMNTGEIEGTAYAILAGGDSTTLDRVTNQGVISSPYDAVYLTGGALNLVNSGEVDGLIIESNASAGCSILNSGVINGQVVFGSYGDLYDGRSGSISGSVNGGDGNDSLKGGVGEDTLVGGLGRDRLDGGVGGGDTFAFTDIKDSKASSFDVIAKHWSGSDTIDLSAIDANTKVAGVQHFTFADTVSGVTGLTIGEVGYFKQGGDTYVVADVNGDGKADFELQVHGSFTLTADQFVL